MLLTLVAKEQFTYPETRQLFGALETLRKRSGVSRGQAFEDWLTAMVCALAAETKEQEYLAMVERHKKGKQGKRGIDLMGEMFGQLVHTMSQESDADILGDLFQGAITYGENGLYLTPNSITQLLAQLTVDVEVQPQDGPPSTIYDCCCGTGRMLLEAAKINPEAELVGQDIDSRCAQVTAINLGLRSKYGWVICGNTLSGETQFAYRIGHFFHEGPNGLRRGVIREVPVEQTPVPVIATRSRQEAKGLFDEPELEESVSTDTALPTVIEIPQWLARLEPKLATLDRDERQGSEQSSEKADSKCEDPPAKQQELF